MVPNYTPFHLLTVEYIREPWHMFDFAIVLLSIGDWVLHLLAAAVGTNPTLVRILRIV